MGIIHNYSRPNFIIASGRGLKQKKLCAKKNSRRRAITALTLQNQQFLRSLGLKLR